MISIISIVNATKAEIVGLAGTVGFVSVMLTIGLGLGRTWTQLDPGVFADTFPATFAFLLPAIAVTLTPGLVGVWIARREATPSRRPKWKLALAGLAVSLLITVAYHVPANYRLWRSDLSDSDISTELDRWLAFHAVRLLAGAVAMIAAFLGTTRTSPTDACVRRPEAQ